MRPWHILIVDDESNIRLMLRTALSTSGYDVAEASNGRQALEAVAQRKPDLMILDLSMPELDGMGVLESLRQLRPSLRPKVVVLTAYGSIAAAVRATRLGAMDFLEKPVSPGELREAVTAALAEPAATEAVLVPAAAADEQLAGGYAAVLDRARRALHAAEFSDAESLLMKAADLGERDAAYFNLLGVLYEVQRKWRLAKKCYGKAIVADRKYEPSQTNMRRMYELETFGKTVYSIAMGDEVAAGVNH